MLATSRFISLMVVEKNFQESRGICPAPQFTAGLFETDM